MKKRLKRGSVLTTYILGPNISFGPHPKYIYCRPDCHNASLVYNCYWSVFQPGLYTHLPSSGSTTFYKFSASGKHWTLHTRCLQADISNVTGIQKDDSFFFYLVPLLILDQITLFMSRLEKQSSSSTICFATSIYFTALSQLGERYITLSICMFYCTKPFTH